MSGLRDGCGWRPVLAFATMVPFGIALRIACLCRFRQSASAILFGQRGRPSPMLAAILLLRAGLGAAIARYGGVVLQNKRPVLA